MSLHTSFCFIPKEELRYVVVHLIHFIEGKQHTFHGKPRRPKKKSPHMWRPLKTSNFDANRSLPLIELFTSSERRGACGLNKINYRRDKICCSHWMERFQRLKFSKKQSRHINIIK